MKNNMGGGSYSYNTSIVRASNVYKSMDRNEVFTSTSLNPQMDIKNKVRECVDSEEHPNAFPIIIGLDVTGSMGQIPYELITNTLPEIMKKILDEGVKDPQVCFLGIGDSWSDRVPLQVGQFESSDELMEKWLKLVYLEGGGGGNGGEDYGLAWYFAARHTSVDSFKKHGRKGVLITIGDEPIHTTISKNTIKELFGSAEADIDVASILNEVKTEWDVYHINIPDYSGKKAITKNCWNKLLQDRVLHIEADTNEAIADGIVGAILNSYKDADSGNNDCGINATGSDSNTTSYDEKKSETSSGGSIGLL